MFREKRKLVAASLNALAHSLTDMCEIGRIRCSVMREEVKEHSITRNSVLMETKVPLSEMCWDQEPAPGREPVTETAPKGTVWFNLEKKQRIQGRVRLLNSKLDAWRHRLIRCVEQYGENLVWAPCWLQHFEGLC